MTAQAHPTDASPDPDAHKDPIEQIFAELQARLRQAAEDPEAKLTCDSLIEIIGPASYTLALFVFCLLNLIPAPPGYNFFMALVITALSAAMLFDRRMRLPRAFGRIRLPTKALLKLLDLLAQLTTWIAKVSSPRLLPLTAPAARPFIALIGIVLGIAMLAPIPFTNMLPSIGLAMICIGHLNRDGLVVIAGIAVGLIGVIILWLCISAIIALITVIEDVVDPDADAE